MGPLGFFAGICVTVGPFCFVSGTVAVGLVLFVVLRFCIFYIVVFNYICFIYIL